MHQKCKTFCEQIGLLGILECVTTTFESSKSLHIKTREQSLNLEIQGFDISIVTCTELASTCFLAA